MRHFITTIFYLIIIIAAQAQQHETDSLAALLQTHKAADSTRFFILKRLAYLYSFTNAEQGNKIADEAISLAQQLHDNGKLAGAYANKATNLHVLAKDSMAFVYYKKAVAIHLQNNNKKAAAGVLFNMGYVYFDIDDYTKAIESVEAALDIYRQLNSREDEADCYNNLANSYMRIALYPIALKNFLAALNIYEDDGNENYKAITLANIGIIYSHLQDTAKAAGYYISALKIDELNNNKNNLAHDYENFGLLYADDAAKALPYYVKALQINKEINNNKSMASNHADIGAAYITLKNYDSAYQHLQKALSLAEMLDNSYLTANALNETGNLLLQAPRLFFTKQHINYNSADSNSFTLSATGCKYC